MNIMDVVLVLSEVALEDGGLKKVGLILYQEIGAGTA
jgi:hypothetical protein